MCNNKFLYTFLLLCCVGVLGCFNPKESSQAENKFADSLFNTISIDFNRVENRSGRPFNISEISDTVTYIPLQTNDSIIIGNIRRLIVISDTMYIWDDTSDEIYCFNSNGEYIYRISRKGRGYDEYARIMDFFVHPESCKIYIYSDVNQKIYGYNSRSELVSQIDIPFTIKSFAVSEHFRSYYSGAIPNGEYDEGALQYVYRWESEREQGCQLPFFYQEDLLKIASSNNNFSYYNDTLLLTDYITAKTYKIHEDGKLFPRYSMNFKSNLIEIDYNSRISLNDIVEAQKNGTFTSLHNSFFENDKYIFFNFSRGIIGLGIIDKNINKINCEYFIIDDFSNNTLNTSIAYVDSECMYKITEPHMLIPKLNNKRLRLSPTLTKQIEKMSEFDNPVIIKVYLK